MKKIHCYNCGEDLGEGDPRDGPESCARRECIRELRYAIAAERNERQWRAEEDDYGRYAW